MSAYHWFEDRLARSQGSTVGQSHDKTSGRQASLATNTSNTSLQPKSLSEKVLANNTAFSSGDTVRHQVLDIRTKDAPKRANQSSESHLSTPSRIDNQKRPHYVIDLTEDDDEDEPFPPRKKSCSFFESSDDSIKLVSRSRRPIKSKQEDKDPPFPADVLKQKRVTPPEYEKAQSDNSVSSEPSPKLPLIQQTSLSPSQRTITKREQSEPPIQNSPSPQSNERASPSQRPPQLSASSEERITQHPPFPRQYASAVIVRPASQLGHFTPEELQQRRDFERNLAAVPMVTLTNTIDNSSPPTRFRFIQESELREGVSRASQDVMVGCDCRRKRGANECKYPNECSCLRDSNGESLIKRSQYSDSAQRKGCLMKQVLQARWNIFECNPRCDCSANCKNRVVQWGRKVGLDIFKTAQRGWGLRCHQDLLEGQFVDTYRGEIITTEEADERKKGANEDNYLMDFDKFQNEDDAIDAKYVCDGMYMGGPTRFMNHSCEPNCALFTVSYNHYDPWIYELAFFAKEFIPAGTELTFDYLDQDEVDGGGRITDEDAAEMEREKGYAPSVCRCGAENCRGYFFFSK